MKKEKHVSERESRREKWALLDEMDEKSKQSKNHSVTFTMTMKGNKSSSKLPQLVELKNAAKAHTERKRVEEREKAIASEGAQEEGHAIEM